MFRFAPLRGAVLSCLAKKVPKEGAAGEALRYVYRSVSRIAPVCSTYNRPPLRTPPGAARGRYYDVVGILPMCETHR